MRQQNVLASAVSGQPSTFPWIATRGHSISLTAGHRSCAAFAIRRTQNANSKTVASAPIAARNTKRDENAVVNIFVEGLRILAEGRSVSACGGTVRLGSDLKHVQHVPPAAGNIVESPAFKAWAVSNQTENLEGARSGDKTVRRRGEVRAG